MLSLKAKVLFIVIILFSITVNATDYTYHNNSSASINETSTPCTSPLELSFNVSGTYTIAEVEIGINLSHTNRGDLQMELESPEGTIVSLASNAGGTYNNYDIYVSDNNSNSIGGSSDDNISSPYYDRLVVPAGSMSDFDGENSQGVWILRICDSQSGNSGSFNRAKLVISDGLTISDWDGDGILDINDEDDDNDGIPDEIENTCQTAQFINGDFEDINGTVTTWDSFDASDVPGWNTTSADNMIEIWNDGFNSVPAYSGTKFAEINANNAARLYQTLSVSPGDVVSWSVAHRGRQGVDVMYVMVGPTGNPSNQQIASTDETAWVVYTNNYTVPAGVYEIEIGFEAISSTGPNTSYGNLIDDVELYIISSNSCDTDDDGVANYLDLDSDNDGISDVIEAGGSDPDGDGIIESGSITDTDGDGLDNSVDTDNGGTALSNPDSDSDGLYDVHDIDSDNDGIIDLIEAQSTASFVGLSGNDNDNDGLDDSFDSDNGGTYIVPVNTDSGIDSQPDYLDLNSDDDDHSDNIEAYDTDNDGIANTEVTNIDTDNDGLDNAYDSDGSSSVNNGGSDNNGQLPTNFPNDDFGSSERDWREGNSDSGILPVELLSFEAKFIEDFIELNWTTSTETNNDFFEIEKSYNLINYKSIAKIDGNGNTHQLNEYSYYDYDIKYGIVYYRLKQTDFNGKYTYSDIISLEIKNPYSVNIKNIYPVPASNRIFIEFSAETNSDITYYISDVNGKIVKSGIINSAKTRSLIQINELDRINNGVYFIYLKSEEGISRTQKIIIK